MDHPDRRPNPPRRSDHHPDESRPRPTPPEAEPPGLVLARTLRELRRMVERIADAEEQADAAAATVAELGRTLEHHGGGRADLRHRGRGDAGPSRRSRFDLDMQRRELAARGTGEFALGEEDGRCVAWITGKRVVLSPTQAVLLAVLAADTGDGDDPLVDWKTTHEVLDAVSRQTRRPMKPGALRQNITRLRQRLDRAGVDRYLIQRRGSLIRFALRRPGRADPARPPVGPGAGERRVVEAL